MFLLKKKKSFDNVIKFVQNDDILLSFIILFELLYSINNFCHFNKILRHKKEIVLFMPGSLYLRRRLDR